MYVPHLPRETPQSISEETAEEGLSCSVGHYLGGSPFTGPYIGDYVSPE